MTDQTPNQQRASYAADLLEHSDHYDATDLSGIHDLLSDLMHLCNGKAWDFIDILRVATDNFNAEVMDKESNGRQV